MTPSLTNAGAALNLEVVVGATFGPFDVYLSNPDGTPVDLTGASVHAAARRQPGDADSFLAIQTDVVDAAGGHWRLQIGATETATLQVGQQLAFAVTLADAQGRVLPLYVGTLKGVFGAA